MLFAVSQLTLTTAILNAEATTAFLKCTTLVTISTFVTRLWFTGRDASHDVDTPGTNTETVIRFLIGSWKSLCIIFSFEPRNQVL